MIHIANHRFVVIGRSQRTGNTHPIAATDDRAEADQVLRDGREVNGVRWDGVRVHDRRTEGLVPVGGWSS